MEIITPSAFRMNMTSEARDRGRIKRRVMYPIIMSSISLSSEYTLDSNSIMLDHSLYDSHNESTTSYRSPLTYSSYPVGRGKHLKQINDLWNEMYSEAPRKQAADHSPLSSSSSPPRADITCSSLKSIIKCSKNVSSRGTSSPKCSSHVNFPIDMIEVHTFEDDDESRSSRRGHWKTDGDRFRQRVERAEIMLKPIFAQVHRDKIWSQLQ